jgi:hypothetical protein
VRLLALAIEGGDRVLVLVRQRFGSLSHWSCASVLGLDLCFPDETASETPAFVISTSRRAGAELQVARHSAAVLRLDSHRVELN